VQLILEGIAGTAVFVRCFVDRHRIGEQVMDKLGNGFTRAPFAAVVVRSSSKLGLTACIILHSIDRIFLIKCFLCFCKFFEGMYRFMAFIVPYC
jgi:hypothetical protein